MVPLTMLGQQWNSDITPILRLELENHRIQFSSMANSI